MNPALEIDILLALGPLLVVPLGLKLFRWADPQAERLRAMAQKAIPFAAVAAALSVVPRDAAYQDILGGVLAAGWLAVCVVLAISAGAELLKTRQAHVEVYLPMAACMYLAAGAVWLVLFRAGVRPFDQPIEIVQLTSIHFHFAGFGVPIIAAQAARWLRVLPGKWDRLAAYCGLGAVVAMVLISGVFAGSPLLELQGSVIMAVSLVGIAAGTTLVAFRLALGPRLLLLVASAAVWVSMILAVQFSVGRFAVTSTVSFQQMARTHGTLNVVFTLFALAGWMWAARRNVLVERPAEPAEPADPAAAGPEEP